MRTRIISVSRRVDVFQIRRNRPCRAAATTRADALLGLKPAATNTLVSITIPSMGIPTAGFVIGGSEIAAIWIDRTLDVPRKCGGLDFVAVEIMNEGGEIARLRGLTHARRAGALTSEFQRSRVEFDHCRLAARRGGRGDCQSHAAHQGPRIQPELRIGFAETHRVSAFRQRHEAKRCWDALLSGRRWRQGLLPQSRRDQSWLLVASLEVHSQTESI